IMVFTACNTTDFFNEYQSLSDGWKKNEPVVFDFESLDTLKTYDAYLNIRTTNEYPYSNLFVIVKMTEPEGATMMDTLQYEMANPDGSMMGSGFTDIKEHKLVWRKNISLNKQGVYNIIVNYVKRKINTEPKGSNILDTLQYEKSNTDGSMMGSGFKDIKEHKLVWRKNISLKKQGVYTIEVNHATRKINEVNGDVVLNGVIEIGLQLQ